MYCSSGKRHMGLSRRRKKKKRGTGPDGGGREGGIDIILIALQFLEFMVP